MDGPEGRPPDGLELPLGGAGQERRPDCPAAADGRGRQPAPDAGARIRRVA
jgi:hypothetical protein